MESNINVAYIACVILCSVTIGWSCEPIDTDNRPKISLSLDGEKTLTLACGLSVPKIKDSRGFPTITVGIHRRNPSDDDLSVAYQLWKADQFVAAWRDPATNVVSLFRMLYPFPRGYRPEQLLSANEFFLNTREMATNGYSNISPDNIQDWLYTYYQGRYSTDQNPIWTGEGIKECYKYSASINGRVHRVYVFNVKNEKGIIAGQTPYFVLDITTEKAGITTSLDHFAEQFLKKTRFEAAGYLTERDFWNTEIFDSFMRANAVRGVLNLADEWRDFHYGHFVLLSNNPACYDSAAQGLIYLQNAYRLFPTVLPPCNPSSAQSELVLRVFATAWEFEDCLPQSRRWAGGVYAGNDEILLRGWSNGCNVHEATHQYLHLASGRRGVSTWFNEGFACYFGGCQVVDQQLVAEPIDSGHLLISMMKKKEMSTIEDVFTVRDFYQDEEMERNPKSPIAALKRAKNYTASWGIIYFLREAPTYYPSKNYEMLIPLYWETFQRTGDADSATRAVLRKLTMPTFLDDFRDFFLTFEELYKGKERNRGTPLCDCEYCEMLRRTKQPYPPELSLCLDDKPSSTQAENLSITPTKRSTTTNISQPKLKITISSETNVTIETTIEDPEQDTNHKRWIPLLTAIGLLGFVLFCVYIYIRRVKY